MPFYDLVDKVVELLRRQGRLSYRALKRDFDLDDARIDDLKVELIEVRGWPPTGMGPFWSGRGRAGAG